jgi:cell division protein FtsN
VGELLEPASEVVAEELPVSQPPPVVAEAEPQIEPVVTEPAISELEAPPERPPALIAEEETLAEEVAPPVAPTPPEPIKELICGTVGKFGKRSQAELLSVRLLAQGVKTDITSELSNTQAGFWVLIPPQPDRSAAIKIAKQLEAAGVADLWRFTSGKLAHAISLGLFRDRERAQARRDQIANLGFEPEVSPRYREQTHYWLNYRYIGETPLTKARWQELKEQHPELEREEEPCP